MKYGIIATSAALIFWINICNAAIYRSTDAQGNVIFTDAPSPGATTVDLPPPQVYSAPVIPASNPAPAQSATTSTPTTTTTATATNNSNPTTPQAPVVYQSLQTSMVTTQITRSGDPQSQTFPVAVAINPALGTGDKVVLLIDNKPTSESSDNSSTQYLFTLNLENIFQGTHTAQAQVVDSNANVKIASNSVTFYVYQPFIRNHSNNANHPTPPPPLVMDLPGPPPKN